MIYPFKIPGKSERLTIRYFMSISICILFIQPTSAPAQSISGTLTTKTTLDYSFSPWQVTDDLIIKNGGILTIEAGCTLYIAKGVGITVQSGGQLVAMGDQKQRIIMTKQEGTSDRWSGIRFEDSKTNNKLSYVDMLYADAQRQIIYVENSSVILDNMTWNTEDRTVVEMIHPSMIIQNCIFPGVGEVEVIHGNYLSGDDYLVLISNTFGKPLGYNDVIDFTDCKLPGPIFEAYNNVFHGGGDDGIDLDGADAHIEGNVFTRFHKGHTGASTSNAIATGVRNGKTSDIMVVRNIFYDNDYAVLLKEGCTMIAKNNTIVKCDSSAINFSEWPYRTVAPGKSARLSGNIFWNNRHVFENQFSQAGELNPDISIDYCLVDSALHYLGSNNINSDPLFVNSDSDFHLLSYSPAIGAGPNELDMGAYVPAGLSISGEPPDSTVETTTILNIGGPGMTHYRFAVNDPNDPWSEIRSIKESPNIELVDLMPGTSYRLFLLGKTYAGHWQNESDYKMSKEWTVIYPLVVDFSKTQLPRQFHLYNNFPNPFNSNTLLRFDVPEKQRIRIEVYNVVGKKMKTLVEKLYDAGTYELKLSTKNWSSGVYYYRMTAGDYHATRRMLLVR